MLYDQAMLVLVYAEYFAVTNDPTFSEIAKQVIQYVVRDLKNKEGGFFCAEDADSEGEEGKFYIWSYDELKSLLSKKELHLTEKVYGIKKEGNFFDEASKKLSLTNIFHIQQSRLDKNDDFLSEQNKASLTNIRNKLF